MPPPREIARSGTVMRAPNGSSRASSGLVVEIAPPFPRRLATHSEHRRDLSPRRASAARRLDRVHLRLLQEPSDQSYVLERVLRGFWRRLVSRSRVRRLVPAVQTFPRSSAIL